VERLERHLIVGSGMTAIAAARAIRERDAGASIVIVGDEHDLPYKRPPLTKGLWQGKEIDSVFYDLADLAVDLQLGRRIESLDLEARTATDDRGGEHAYDKLLLATGGRPRRLAAGGDDVVYFRTLEDYRRTRALAGAGSSFAVIGGGFIGSEIAAALTSAGCRVTMVFPEEGIGARIFPAELSAFVTGYYREHGVDVQPGTMVGDVAELGAEAVVAGLGILPAVELAEAAGLPVNDGIVVDELGRVGGREDVFAAGDVARFPLLALGRDTRVEHEDHAISHGRAVGANMAGAAEPYDQLPFFYSDLFDLGYEAVGSTDPSQETVAEWADPNRKGVIAYLDDERRPVGFLLWDVWGKVDAARELIRARAPLPDGALSALVG
jgi:NADPH-dependent 2,4-dienoyl-CoA reductase/sulfur reductase-like enzyme